MTMTIKHLLQTTAAAAVLVPSFAACGQAAGQGSAAGLTVRASGSQQQALEDGTPAPVITDEGGNTLVLREGVLAIEEIELELPRGTRCADIDGDLVGAVCEDDDIDDDNDDDDNDDDGDSDDSDDDESKVVIRGPFLVDLVTGTSEPSLADVRIPATTYARIDIEIDETGALNGRSFVGELGLIRPDNTEVLITFGLDVDEEIRVERPDGVAVAADASLLIQFVVDDWFAGADLAGCIDDGFLTVVDGRADLGDGDDVCGDIEDLVEANMEGDLDLGIDDDDDDSDDDGDDSDDDDSDDSDDDDDDDDT